MDILSPAFLSALLAIIVIDLALAGDNAIVIALAARGLPARERRLAILWGTAGAVIVRCLMTLAVVWPPAARSSSGSRSSCCARPRTNPATT